MSDRWIITVPVISTAHLQERTFAALVGDIMRGRWAGAAGPDMVWIHVPEAPPDAADLDFHALCSWARDEGYEYVRLDANGDRIEDLPTYDWGADSSEDRDATYHNYHLSTAANGSVSGWIETNDDNDDGIPDDDISRWEISFKDRAEAMRRIGGSHTGVNGCKVEVFIDGKRV